MVQLHVTNGLASGSCLNGARGGARGGGEGSAGGAGGGREGVDMARLLQDAAEQEEEEGRRRRRNGGGDEEEEEDAAMMAAPYRTPPRPKKIYGRLPKFRYVGDTHTLLWLLIHMSVCSLLKR